MKIEATQLPEKVKEALSHLFYMWDDFPPSWLDVEIDMVDEQIELIMRFDEKQCELYFTRYDDCSEWELEVGEDNYLSLDDFHFDTNALFQMLFNIQKINKNSDEEVKV